MYDSDCLCFLREEFLMSIGPKNMRTYGLDAPPNCYVLYAETIGPATNLSALTLANRYIAFMISSSCKQLIRWLEQVRR